MWSPFQYFAKLWYDICLSSWCKLLIWLCFFFSLPLYTLLNQCNILEWKDLIPYCVFYIAYNSFLYREDYNLCANVMLVGTNSCYATFKGNCSCYVGVHYSVWVIKICLIWYQMSYNHNLILDGIISRIVLKWRDEY